MPNSESKGYPVPSLRRLPLYLRYLRNLRAQGKEVVSCTHIANDLGLVPVQIRKDLAMTGIVGRPKVGYDVADLISAVESFLGWNSTQDAFLVGAGYLGTALLGYDGFAEHGLRILAAFDNSPEKIGTVVHGKEIHPLERFPEMARRMNILIGVLTVPGSAASDVTKLMIDSGIRAIWNYTPVTLDLPETIVCEDVKLSSGLAVLSCRLKTQLAEEDTTVEDGQTSENAEEEMEPSE